MYRKLYILIRVPRLVSSMNPVKRVKEALVRRELRNILKEMEMNKQALSGVGAVVVGVVIEAAKSVVANGQVDIFNWKSALGAFLISVSVAIAHRLNPPAVK